MYVIHITKMLMTSIWLESSVITSQLSLQMHEVKIGISVVCMGYEIPICACKPFDLHRFVCVLFSPMNYLPMLIFFLNQRFLICMAAWLERLRFSPL